MVMEFIILMTVIFMKVPIFFVTYSKSSVGKFSGIFIIKVIFDEEYSKIDVIFEIYDIDLLEFLVIPLKFPILIKRLKGE